MSRNYRYLNIPKLLLLLNRIKLGIVIVWHLICQNATPFSVFSKLQLEVFTYLISQGNSALIAVICTTLSNDLKSTSIYGSITNMRKNSGRADLQASHVLSFIYFTDNASHSSAKFDRWRKFFKMRNFLIGEILQIIFKYKVTCWLTIRDS